MELLNIDAAPALGVGTRAWQDDPPTQSDTIAIGLLQAAFKAHVVVPERLSIVGFDDIDIAAFTVPPLTTISQSGVEMDRIAANLLLDTVEDRLSDGRVADVIVAPTLVVRQSTAPAPG